MHLATVALLIDDDPELAHQHALSASRRAGRIPVTRETLAVTAYRTGDFALALRELRTYRRLTGSDAHLALMIDCERGLGRPEKAIETGLSVDRAALDKEDRVQLAIAMSGARLDLGQTQQALFELEIPELQVDRAYSWSAELFAAYAAVLEDLGREDEAQLWQRRAQAAEAALQDHYGQHDVLEVMEIHEARESFEAADEDEDSDYSEELDEDAEGTEETGDGSEDTEAGTEPDAAEAADAEEAEPDDEGAAAEPGATESGEATEPRDQAAEVADDAAADDEAVKDTAGDEDLAGDNEEA